MKNINLTPEQFKIFSAQYTNELTSLRRRLRTERAEAARFAAMAQQTVQSINRIKHSMQQYGIEQP